MKWKFEIGNLERIRPPYRPDDDIPFKGRGWRLFAVVVVVLAGLGALAGVIGWLRWIFRGMDEVLLFLILLFMVIMAPLVFAVWRYFREEK